MPPIAMEALTFGRSPMYSPSTPPNISCGEANE